MTKGKNSVLTNPTESIKDGSSLFESVSEQAYAYWLDRLMEMRRAHPLASYSDYAGLSSYRDDQLLMFLLCRYGAGPVTAPQRRCHVCQLAEHGFKEDVDHEFTTAEECYFLTEPPSRLSFEMAIAELVVNYGDEAESNEGPEYWTKTCKTLKGAVLDFCTFVRTSLQ